MAREGPGPRPQHQRHDLVAELLRSLPRPGERVAAALDAVLVLASASCPSCTAVSLTLDNEGRPVTVTATRGGARGHAASIAVQLPWAEPAEPARPSAVLVVFATDAAALVRLADDIAVLLEIPARRIRLVGASPVPPDTAAGLVLAGQLDDLATVDRALGALLEQGWVPAQCRTELQRRADGTGASLVQAAAALLSVLPGGAPAPPGGAPAPPG